MNLEKLKNNVEEQKRVLLHSIKTLYKYQALNALEILQNKDNELKFEAYCRGYWTPISEVKDIYLKDVDDIVSILNNESYFPSLIVITPPVAYHEKGNIERIVELDYIRRISDKKSLKELI